MSNEPRTFVVERRSIEFIPQSERHGSVFSLFTLWFAANMQITTVVTGAVWLLRCHLTACPRHCDVYRLFRE